MAFACGAGALQPMTLLESSPGTHKLRCAAAGASCIMGGSALRHMQTGPDMEKFATEDDCACRHKAAE